MEEKQDDGMEDAVAPVVDVMVATSDEEEVMVSAAAVEKDPAGLMAGGADADADADASAVVKS